MSHSDKCHLCLFVHWDIYCVRFVTNVLIILFMWPLNFPIVGRENNSCHVDDPLFVFQVSRSQFQDYCISHLDSLQSSPDQMREANQDQNHHDSLEDDSEFCDKKLLAINHLYNNSSEAILSVRGTVRGIRNRVRAGIKTFAPEKVTLAAIMVITVKPKWTFTNVASRSRKSYNQGP